jgi:hypothetical protein
MTEIILCMQVIEQLAVHSILDCVHHLRLRQNRLALLLNPCLQELCFKRHLQPHSGVLTRFEHFVLCPQCF